MTWTAILPLIARYGIPVAYELYTTITKHPNPNEAAWQELLALNSKTDEQYLKEAQERAAASP